MARRDIGEIGRRTRRCIGLAAIAALGGCEFNPPNPADPDAPPPDAPNVPPDGAEPPRVEDGLLAYWKFDETSGAVANDTRNALNSPSIPPTQLVVTEPANVRWTGGGLELTAPVRIGTTERPHISQDVRATNAVTIEIWVTPALLSQGENNYALAFSISPFHPYHNAMIAQVGNRWEGRILTTETESNAAPFITATDVAVELAPVHLVLVASATERAMYVNGARYRSAPDAGIGNLKDPRDPRVAWQDYFPLSVGNEPRITQPSDARPWLGTIYLAAIYDRALSETEIRKNHGAGYDCVGC